MTPVTVLLVDDHTLVRRGIAGLLSQDPEILLVGEACDGKEALEQARALRPDVVLMDVRMPGCDGLTATRLIRGELPEVRIVMLTVSEEEHDLFEAIKSGAKGYLLKRMEPKELCAMVHAAFRGEAPVAPQLATRIMDEFSRMAGGTAPQKGPALLSPREHEVLGLVAEGLPNKLVASALGISENTVRNHLRNILEKLHLNNRVEAAAYAIRQRLAGPHSPDRKA